MRVGEVIAKLAEDTYFMRVDNRVTQMPFLRTRKADREATSHSPADNGRNRTRGELRQNPNRTRASARRPSQGGHSAGRAGGSRAVVARGDAGRGGRDGGSSSHGMEGEPVAEAITEAEAMQIATSPVSHAGAMMPFVESRKFDGTNPQERTTASPPSLLDFAICCSQRNSSLRGSLSTTRSKTQYSGLGATPSPWRTLVETTT
jgi:hypothetical protein